MRELLGLTTSAEGDEHPQLASIIERAPSRPRLSRLTKTLWVGSVAAAAALAAGITVTAVGIVPVSASSGASQIATLEQTTAVTIPEGWLGAGEGSPVFEFHGVTLFTSWMSGNSLPRDDADPACLTIVETAAVPPVDEFNPQSWSYSGMFGFYGCATGRFPAKLAVPIDDHAPEELRAAFPEARALQFVLADDRVGVFLDDGD